MKELIIGNPRRLQTLLLPSFVWFSAMAPGVDSYHSETLLDFQNLHLYGRDEDIALLDEVYQRCLASSRPQIVWLKGNPGVGKSTLAEHAFLAKDNYVSGKFERLRSSVPYPVLTQVLTKLCYILEYEGHRVPSLRVEDESTLSRLVPEIDTVVESSQPKDGNVRGAASNKVE